MSVINMTVGATNPGGATFAAKVNGGGPVRIRVANNPGMSSPTVFGPQSVNAQGVAKVSATGLQPNTRYWWRVQDGGSVDNSVTGQFITHPPLGSVSNFTVAFAGDAGLDPVHPGVGNVLASNRLSNHPVFDTIRQRALAEDWLFFGHLGDATYYDIGSGVHVPNHTITTYRRQIDDILLQPRQHQLYREVPWVWTWDDHDWGPNDSDGTHPGGPNAQQAYREKFPHYPLPHANAIYQTWQIGRVMFIMSDSRSHRDPNDNPDVPGKTQLGTAQKAWMQNILETSDAGFLVWVLSGQWMGASNESYNVQFTHEQKELSELFISTGWQNRMCVVSADIHELGIETGSRSAGALPLFHFASLDARGSEMGHSRYDTGVSRPGRNQYGTLEIQDNGTQILVTGTAWVGEEAWKSYTVATIPESSFISPVVFNTLPGPHEALVEARVLTEFQTSPEPEGVEIPVLGGSVTYDATAQVFSSLTLETEGHDGKRSLFPKRASDLLAPYGNEIFVRRGIDLGEEVLWFPLGIFRINDVEQSDQSGSTIRITGQDRMASIIDGELTEAVQYPATWHIGSIIRNLVRPIYPDAVIAFDDEQWGSLSGRQLVIEQSRYDALQHVADSLGKIMFWDSAGVLVFRDPPDPTDIAWELRAGASGVLVKADRSITRDGVKNAWVVRGEGAAEFPARAVAVDSGANSPTKFGGPFGRVPGFFSSPLVTSVLQASAAARGKLRRHIGMPYSVNFGSVPNPALRPWDTIRITHKDRSREKHLVVTNTIPLSDGEMSGTTREQTRVLLTELTEGKKAQIGLAGEDL